MTETEEKTKKPPIDQFYLMAEEIAMGLAGGDYVYCTEEDCFYFYTDGYWKKIYDNELMKRIAQYVPKFKKWTLSGKKQVIENIKIIKDIRVEKLNQQEILNLKNGILIPKEQRFIEEHSPDYYSTMRLPYEYSQWEECPLWLKTLNEILENDKDKIEILQEFFGYCLTRDTKHHKALLLLGESRSGKSTILFTLRAMIGDINCSSLPLKHIANPQCTAMLLNKLVNIDTDVSAKAVEFEAEFKTITSGEPLHCNEKFVTPFDFNPFCKLIMAANIFPKITDHSSAFYNRLILVPCDRVFEPSEQNKDLPVQLRNELPGILNWSLEGLKNLTQRGGFKEYSFMREAVEELENENNPVNLFFDEHIITDFNGYIEKGFLYEKYKDWCMVTKNYTLSLARFSSCVFKRFHKETPKSCRLADSTQKRIWKNLKYVEFKAVTQDKGWQE